MTWRATIALAALLTVALTGVVVGAPAEPRDGAPAIVPAHTRASRTAELRRGREGTIASRAVAAAGVGPFALGAPAGAAPLVRRAVPAGSVTPPDRAPRRSWSRAIARAPPPRWAVRSHRNAYRLAEERWILLPVCSPSSAPAAAPARSSPISVSVWSPPASSPSRSSS